MTEPKLTKEEWHQFFHDLNTLSAAGDQVNMDELINTVIGADAGYSKDDKVTFLEASISAYR